MADVTHTTDYSFPVPVDVIELLDPAMARRVAGLVENLPSVVVDWESRHDLVTGKHTHFVATITAA